ncbi:hypothetical protein MCAMS1_02458 [biofilm metagenome]
MKPVLLIKGMMLITTVLFAVNAFAYNDEKEKELCRPPKIQEFTLPIYSETNKVEVEPESEFSFVVSGWANPKKIKLNGKGIDIPFTVKSTETFHKVHAKLPAAFNGQTVRISTRIPAVLECYSTLGWLIKVANKSNAGQAPAASYTASEQSKPVASGTQTTPAAKPAPQTETPSAEPAK